MSKETEKIEKGILAVVKTPKSNSSNYSNRIFRTESKSTATDGYVLISAITDVHAEQIQDKKFASKLQMRMNECTELFAEIPSEIFAKLIDTYEAEKENGDDMEILFRYDRAFSFKTCIRALEFASKYNGDISVYVPQKGDRKKSPMMLKFDKYEIVAMPYCIRNENKVKIAFDRVDFENAMIEYENHNYSLF